MREEARRGHAFEHFIARDPGVRGEEARGFAERIADDGVGFDGERGDDVVQHRAERDLGKDEGFLIGSGGGGAVAPEEALRELVGEAEIFGVLLVENVREVGEEFAAHAEEVVARAGEDEGEFGGGLKRERVGGEEDAGVCASRGGDEFLRVVREGGEDGVEEGEELWDGVGDEGEGVIVSWL